MKHSLYFRNFIAVALIVFISFTLLGGLSSAWNYRREMTYKRDMMTQTMQETARYVTTHYIYYGIDLSELSLSMWLAFTSGISGFDLIITDADGVVSACSKRDFRNFGQHVPGSMLQMAALGSYSVRLTTLGNIYPERRQIVGTALTGAALGGEPAVFGYLL